MQAEDVAAFFTHQDDAEAAAMAAFPSRDRASHDAHWARVLADPSAVTRTVVETLDGVDGGTGGELVAGYVASFVADGQRLVGYWIGRDFWGRGLATAALRLFVAELPERPLFAHVAEHNVASRTVLRRAGFVPVGGRRFELGDDGVVELLLVLDH